MKISTQIDVGSLLVGEEKTVELIAKAGFDARDFSMFYNDILLYVKFKEHYIAVLNDIIFSFLAVFPGRFYFRF